MIAAEISVQQRELHRRLMKEFLRVFLQMPDRKTLINGSSPLEIAVIKTMEKLKQTNKLADSTVTTYTQALLGAIARQPRLWPFDVTDKVRRQTVLQQWQRGAAKASRQVPKQAQPAEEADVWRIAAEEKEIGAVLAVAFLLCSRVQDLTRNAQNVKVSRATLRITYNNHKTKGTVGARTAEVENALPSITQKFNPAAASDIKRIDKVLQKYNLTRHSLRRGGIKFWRQQGKTWDDILLLTLHTTVAQLMHYANA